MVKMRSSGAAKSRFDKELQRDLYAGVKNHARCVKKYGPLEKVIIRNPEKYLHASRTR